MKRAQLLLVVLGIAILGIVLTQPVKATIQTQQAQIVVNVVVQVVGTPVGYVPHQRLRAIHGRISAATRGAFSPARV